MKKLLFLISLLTFCLSAQAGQSGLGVVKVLQYAYNGWIFSINHADNNPSQCSKPLMILVDHPKQEQMYSLLLAASASGKPVVAYTDGCDSNGYNTVTSIYTKWND